MTDTSAVTDWRFFRWARGMDVPRRAGWIGGVCAGIADRIRIDPIIVRGVAVVLAVLGAPALLLYAAAWMLLPDTDDRIHLERLLRGRFDPAVVGAGVMLLLQLTPLTAGFWFVGYSYWSEPYGGGAWFLRVLWTGFMLTAVVLFILWMARRARNAEQRAAFQAPDAGAPSGAWVAPSSGHVAEGAPSPDAGPATSAHAASPAYAAPSPAPHPAVPAGPTPQPGEPVAPAPPAADAPAEQLAAWRQQHESWKLHHAAWSAQQRQGADAAIRRELAARRAVEREAMRVEWREQQRRRRAANPRVGFVATVLTIGVAVLGAGIVVLALRGAGLGEVSLVAAFATAAALFGAAMIVAGAARRRSGFLAFLASVSLVVASLGALVPTDRELVGGYRQIDLSTSGSYSQPLGTLRLDFQRAVDEDGMMLDLVDGVMSSEGAIHEPGAQGTTRIDLWQGAGNVYLDLPPNAVVQLDLEVGPSTYGSYNEYPYSGGDYRYDNLARGDGRITQTIGEGDGVDVIVTGWIGTSQIEVSRAIADEATDQSQTEEVQP